MTSSDARRQAQQVDHDLDVNRFILVNPSDPATIERAAKGLRVDIERQEQRYGAAIDMHTLAVAVLASLTDTGDNKEHTNA